MCVRVCVVDIVAAMKCVYSVHIIIKRGIKNAILYVYSFDTFMHVCECVCVLGFACDAASFFIQLC